MASHIGDKLLAEVMFCSLTKKDQKAIAKEMVRLGAEDDDGPFGPFYRVGMLLITIIDQAKKRV